MDFDIKQLEPTLTELKTSLETNLTKKAKELIDAQVKTVSDQFEEFKKTAGKPDEATAKLLKEIGDKLDAVKAASDANQPVIDAFVKSPDKPTGGSRKSFNDLLSEGINENADQLKNLKKGKSVSFEMKEVADMSFANNFSTADVSVATLRPGIIELPKRKLHIRELIPGGSMSNSNFVYVKEVAGEEGPETAAEGALKNQFDLDLLEVESPSQYIAGFVVLSRKMLDDVQGMTTFLQSRLMELLLRAEDAQLLNGDGTSPNLSGITDSGNFTAATTSETAEAMMLIDGIAQLEGYDREANGILLNPADYWSMAKITNLNQSQVVTIGEDGVLRIGGVPVFRSTAVAADQYIVGDWRMGANLITREPPRVEFFFEDSDNVRRNKVTVRVEERVAFPIYGDNYFIVGDFGNVS